VKTALAIARRDLVRWFTNPTGYVFIMVFIALCATAQFIQDQFFDANLANLATLNQFFPYILLFFAPAVSMGTWADERRHGTDELLLTLPASDGALLAGKYLAALGIYAASLAFSLTFIIDLSFLGRPDIGLMLGTYIGYVLLGGALITIAMVASLLVESVTVGFILGALFCAVPVFLGKAAGFLGETVASAGVTDAFRDFTTGVGSLQAVAYFAGLAAVGLAMNLALLQRRRMRAEQWHLPIRIASLVVSAACLVVLCDRSGLRVDLTAEGLHSVSSHTREAIAAIPAGKPVFIQAYVSPDVPQDYVETRENLLTLLRDLDALGGGRVNIRVTETTKASEAARDADDRFKIKSVRLGDREGGHGGHADVFLGAAVTSGLDEVVIPFFYRGISPEYELTRSIRVVSKAKRLKVGILTTDAKWFGGFEFTTMQPSQPWAIVEELKKQYEVVQVAPDAAIAETMDVLIAPMPSSLTQAQLDNLFNYVKQGKPALLLDDPLPIINPSIGANEMKGGRRGMMGGAPPEPKGNAREFYRALGLSWEPTDVIWDTYNPHPTLTEVPEEVVFVARANGATEPFNQKSPIAAKLQELVFLFSGCVHSGNVKGIEVTPLVRAGRASGVLSYSEVWRANPFFGGGGLNPQRRHIPSTGVEEPILAARVLGKAGEISIDAIMVSDLDLVSEQFFELRRQGMEGLDFDNVTFILNCVDALAKDEGTIELRSRRPRHRTLEKMEIARREHDKKQLEEARAADEKAEKRRTEAQARFDEAVRKIESRADVDAQTKEIMVQSVRETEQRKLDIEKRRIDDEKETAVARSEAERDAKVNRIHNEVKVMALLGTTLPALIAAMIALSMRIRRELEARR